MVEVFRILIGCILHQVFGRKAFSIITTSYPRSKHPLLILQF